MKSNTAGALKKLLESVPDDFTLHIADLNFGGALDEAGTDADEFRIDAERKRLLIPAAWQEPCE